MRNALLIFTAAVLTAASVCAGGRASAAPPPGPVARDLPELVRAAPLVVVGRVVEVRPGRSAGSGEGRIQFSEVHISVERRLKGDPLATIIVEQVAPAGSTVSPGIGPAYKVGERDVLFLRAGEGSRHVVLPQGRYRLEDGVVHPIGPGSIAEKLRGIDETRFLGGIEAIARGKSQ